MQFRFCSRPKRPCLAERQPQISSHPCRSIELILLPLMKVQLMHCHLPSDILENGKFHIMFMEWRNERSRYSLDYCRDGIGLDDDPARSGTFLRGFGQGPKYLERIHAMLRHCLFDEHTLACRRLFDSVRRLGFRVLGRTWKGVLYRHRDRHAIRFDS